MQPTNLYIIQCLVLCDTMIVVYAEYFTSSIHLNGLLQKELNLREQVRDYIHNRELKLEKLKRFYMKTKDTGKYVSDGNVTLYAGHPLYAYSCIKRMSKDWLKIKTAANEEDSFLSSLYKMRSIFPKDDDVSGAKSAIIRLQETFAIPSRKIMEGLEHGAGLMPKLDVVDAYQFGYHAFRNKKPLQSISWMKEVLRILNLNTTNVEFNITKARFQAYDILSWAEYQIDNILAAYNYTLELLKLEPSNKRIMGNLEFILDTMSEQNITFSNGTSQQFEEEYEEVEIERVQEPYEKFYYLPEEDGYRYDIERVRANALCRGETDPVPKEFEKYLVCWYKRGHPLLILKPAKLERLYPSPEIIMFRDAITEREMTRIKELANPLLRRATVNNPITGKLEYASYRVSKSAWISRYDDALLVNRMNKKIEAYTGLDMKHSEELQIANYGIGGFYESHFDFARIIPIRPPPWKERDDYTRQKTTPLHVKNVDDGERIATMLFYMSDVKLGGATVFTNIGQAVTPSKGDAVFWFNLMHDGTGDYETRHAACPVLIGEKWVCNRWLHEYGQEFRRRCKLRHDDDWWMTNIGDG